MNTKMLCERIDASLIPKVKIAALLGVTRETFYKKIKGEREFKTSEIKLLADLLHLTLEEKETIFFGDYVGKTST